MPRPHFAMHPQKVQDAALRANLEDVVILGFTEAGDFWHGNSSGDAKQVADLCRRMLKHLGEQP